MNVILSKPGNEKASVVCIDFHRPVTAQQAANWKSNVANERIYILDASNYYEGKRPCPSGKLGEVRGGLEAYSQIVGEGGVSQMSPSSQEFCVYDGKVKIQSDEDDDEFSQMKTKTNSFVVDTENKRRKLSGSSLGSSSSRDKGKAIAYAPPSAFVGLQCTLLKHLIRRDSGVSKAFDEEQLIYRTAMAYRWFLDAGFIDEQECNKHFVILEKILRWQNRNATTTRLVSCEYQALDVPFHAHSTPYEMMQYLCPGASSTDICTILGKHGNCNSALDETNTRWVDLKANTNKERVIEGLKQVIPQVMKLGVKKLLKLKPEGSSNSNAEKVAFSRAIVPIEFCRKGVKFNPKADGRYQKTNLGELSAQDAYSIRLPRISAVKNQKSTVAPSNLPRGT